MSDNKMVFVLFISCALTSVSGQMSSQLIVSPAAVREGGSLTVSCDAFRAGVPRMFTNISRVSAGWLGGPAGWLGGPAGWLGGPAGWLGGPAGWLGGRAPPELYKRHRTVHSPYTYYSQSEWNWNFTFSGNLQGTSDRPNNRETMKIQILVDGAMCSDAGLYFCNASYVTSYEDELSSYQYQNVTIIPRVVPHSLTIDPHHGEGLGPFESVNPAGSHVTLTCTVHGPKDLECKWKYANNSSEVNSFTTYPVQNDISVAEPVLVSSGTTCVQYRHTSTLKFQTEYMYDGYMYVCVATENNEDTIVGNMTIYTIQVPDAPRVPRDARGTHAGVIAGPIVAVLVLVAMVTALGLYLRWRLWRHPPLVGL